MTRGEKQERRKETRYLFYAVIRCAINLANIDAGQELPNSFLIIIRRSTTLYFITLSFFLARVFARYIFKFFFKTRKDLDIVRD